jgi:adenosylcobinamide kinase/adenosylcobinamide-phosphate guanylyltransferase
MIYYITGGARSGKSRYAQDLALSLSPSPLYVATARPRDENFQERINRHQADRDARWTTMETDKYPSRLPLTGRVAVIDCITLWLTRFFDDFNYDADTSLAAFKEEMDILIQMEATLIFISNEIGMGVHAETEAARTFTDLQGWANQYTAALADEAVFMVSGLPMKSACFISLSTSCLPYRISSFYLSAPTRQAGLSPLP